MISTRALRAAMVAVTVAGSIGSANASAQERTDFPADARASFEQGQGLRKKGQLDAAIRAYEEAIKRGMNGFPRVHLQRANSNLDLKKYDIAVAQYSKFIEQFGLEESCGY